ncbi:MAG TPA: 3-deoxy-D-manno-octulosonic acid kinase [Rhodanobacter sp.]
MREQLREEADGAILFDVAASPQVGADWFVPERWRERGALRSQAGGRGGVQLIATPAGECVLRHYRRGGMVAKLMGDRYLWRGADATRCFAEFRLLAEIARLGLPGPAPVAARYRKSGPFYRADLITRRIADARTLAECLAGGRLDAELAYETGALVARFHRAGIWHADLNAHNVLVTSSALHLIDFDRGRLRAPAEGWRLANLQRLHRSLVKLSRPGHEIDVFERDIWKPLLYGYERTFGA